MWVARDQDNRLNLFNNLPKRGNGWWAAEPPYTDLLLDCMKINSSLFPELKWEDDPMEVNIIPTKELLSTQKGLNDVYHKLSESQTEIIKLQDQLKPKTFFDENFGEVYYED